MVKGTLTSDQATFTTDTNNNHESGAIIIESGGRLVAKNSLFTGPASTFTISFKPGAIVGPTDLVNNQFDASLIISATAIKQLSASTGGSDNRSFREIYIWNETYTDGELKLIKLGTQNNSKLLYGFFESFTVGRGATLRVAAGVRVELIANSKLTITGNAVFESDSILAFQPNFNPQRPEIIVSGSVTARLSSFTTKTSNNYANGAITIVSGGQLTAESCTFDGPLVSFNIGAKIGPKDFVDNVFNTILILPSASLDMFSSVSGGSDNRSFAEIFLLGTALLSQETLRLRRMGTQSTLNLKYVFFENFVVGANAKLIVDSDVATRIRSNVGLTINGTASFAKGSILEFYAGDSTDRPTLTVNGTLTSDGLRFVSGNYANRGRLIVTPSGVLNATDSTFPSVEPQFGLGSSIHVRSQNGSSFELGFAG